MSRCKSRGLCPSDPVPMNVFFTTVSRYGNSKEHMAVAELKMFLETEQKVCIGNCIGLPSVLLQWEMRPLIKTG